jgi:hypothetical protein
VAFRFLLFTVLAGIVSAATPAAAQSSFTIPFEMIDNRVIVQVMINGKGPYRFILDTGAGAVISTKAAKELGLEVASTGTTAGVGGGRVQSGTTAVQEVQLGPAKFTGESFGVIPFDDMPSVFGTRTIDAIFGTPVFERYVVTHDYIGKKLTFTDPARFHYKGAGTVIQITRPISIPVVQATLDGVPARLGLDTGARSSLLLYTPFVEKNKLREKYKARVEGVTGWGIGGPVHSQLVRAKVLEIGPIKVSDIVVRLSTQKSGLSTGTQLDGLLGPDVLKQFLTIIDYSRMQVILEKNANYGKPDTWDRLGAWLGQRGDTFEVIDVIGGSAAAAGGLKVGDLVLSVNGTPTSKLDLPTVREQMRTLPAGTTVKLLVRSNGKEREMSYTLRDLV